MRSLSRGAGIGCDQFDSNGNPLPDGLELARELAKRFDIDTADSSADLAKISEVVEYRVGRPELDAFIKERLADASPDEHVQWMTTMRWRAIFTTNYDLGILRAYELNPDPPQDPVAISVASELAYCDTRIEVPVYFLHGNIAGPELHLIVTQDDYVRFRERRRMLFEVLKQQCAESTILYIGYSNQDPNWRAVVDEVRSEFSPKSPPQGYRLVKTTDPLDVEILQRKSIDTILGTLAEFHGVASAALSAELTSRDTLEAYRNKIPKRNSQPSLRKTLRPLCVYWAAGSTPMPPHSMNLQTRGLSFAGTRQTGASSRGRSTFSEILNREFMITCSNTQPQTLMARAAS